MSKSKIAYRLSADDARQVGDFLANNMSLDDESSHRVAAALFAFSNGEGAIVLADEDFCREEINLGDA